MIKIGEFPGVDVKLAREIANENKALLARQLDPITERKKLSNKLTFKQFAEQIYLPDAKIRKKSWLDDQRKLSSDMYQTFGDRQLAEITRSDISQYISMILSRTSKSTANRHRALLSSFFNMAIAHDLLEKNNVEHIKKFEESTNHGRGLTAEELQKMIKALDSANNPVSALAVKLLLATGTRKSECLQLEWKNINIKEGSAKLEMETTKGKRARNVILNPSAIAVLKELETYRQPNNPYVFPTRNGGHLTTIRKTFETCKKQAGIENLRLHDCRHTFCTILATSGVSLYQIQHLIGHRSPAMTQRYSHITDTALKEASKIVSDRLGMAAA